MILIVDDNALMRSMMRMQVQNITDTEEIYECSDGHEAVDAYKRFQPEWVLMDIKMPGMDGLTAMRTIQRQFPSARIIIVTNFDDPELRAAARSHGAIGYVLKDCLFELEELMQ